MQFDFQFTDQIVQLWYLDKSLDPGAPFINMN